MREKKLIGLSLQSLPTMREKKLIDLTTATPLKVATGANDCNDINIPCWLVYGCE